jgi:type II secretory pathway pseudopilin PulG
MEKVMNIPSVEISDCRTSMEHQSAGSEGFGLVESLIAILLLALGLMFVGPMIFDAISSTTLARSKDTGALAATNQLETLERLYRANQNDANLTAGDHGPVQVEIVNPVDNSKLNRYSVSWTVVNPVMVNGNALHAVQVTATVTPIASTGTAENRKVRQNKVINITTIFSIRSS